MTFWDISKTRQLGVKILGITSTSALVSNFAISLNNILSLNRPAEKYGDNIFKISFLHVSRSFGIYSLSPPSVETDFSSSFFESAENVTCFSEFSSRCGFFGVCSSLFEF